MKKIKVDISKRTETNQVPVPRFSVKADEKIICYNDNMSVQGIVVKRDGTCMARLNWNTVKFNTKGFYQKNKANTEEMVISRSNYNIPYK